MATHTKVPIEELEARFAQCRAEPSMRSVTAILRITREQESARGYLHHYPRAAVGSAILGAGLFAAVALLPTEFRSKLMPAAIGSVLVTAILAFGAISGTTDRRTAARQERELNRIAAESLAEILNHPFARKPLEREHMDTLRDLAKAHPGLPGLRELMEGPRAA